MKLTFDLAMNVEKMKKTLGFWRWTVLVRFSNLRERSCVSRRCIGSSILCWSDEVLTAGLVLENAWD